MICNQTDLDSCVEWLTRQRGAVEETRSATGAIEVTYRGWHIRLTDEDQVGYAIFPLYEPMIRVAPWLVDKLSHEPTIAG